MNRGQAFDLLASLTDKNLVVAETYDDATRFGTLETVRHYALERLRESGEEGMTRVRHLAYFLSLGERLDGPASSENWRQCTVDTRCDPQDAGSRLPNHRRTNS